MKKFYYLTIGMLLLPALCNSQNIELTFNHKALLVDDLEKSASFYKTILFLEEIQVPEGVTTMRWLPLKLWKAFMEIKHLLYHTIYS